MLMQEILSVVFNSLPNYCNTKIALMQSFRKLFLRGKLFFIYKRKLDCISSQLSAEVFESFSNSVSGKMENFSCEGCKKLHWEYMPWNGRVAVRIKEPSAAFHGHNDDGDLDKLFHLQNLRLRRAVKDFIGEEILSPQAKRILFPYQILGSFLSNAFDLLQSIPLLEIVFFKLVM